MAYIKPFCAIKPKKGKEAEFSSLPYDVYSEAEARRIVKQNPNSFLSIDRPETLLEEGVDIYSQKCYEKANEVFWDRVQKGDYIQDTQEMFYIYQLEMNHRTQTGIVACASVDDYLNQVIKKHENTRADKELDRIKHVSTMNAQTGPIFLAYEKQEVIEQIVNRITKTPPCFEFVAEDETIHRGYLVDQPSDINAICETFQNLNSIYIADGHHRCQSAVKVCEERRKQGNVKPEDEVNYFLSVLFPSEQLMIMDYNRIVKDLNGYSEQEILDKIELVCNIQYLEGLQYHTGSEKKATPNEKGMFFMYLNSKWYQVTVKKEYLSSDPVEGLDVSLLQNLILEPIFQIFDPKTDQRIDFVGGIRGAKELEKRVEEHGGCAFYMYPTSITELMAVSDAGKLMPPKSTWFEPKLRSGLYIHEIMGGSYGEKTIQTNELARN